MERRDVSKSKSKIPAPESASAFPGSDDSAPLDLFSIDLDAELLPSSQPASDPFATDLPLDLSLNDIDPFAVSTSDTGSVTPNGADFDPFAADLPTLQPASEPASVAAAAVLTAGSKPADSAEPKSAQPQATQTQKTQSDAAQPEPDEPAPLTKSDLVKRRFLLTALPSWAISLGVHVTVLFLLAAMSMDPIREAIGTALESGGGNEGETLEDTELPGPMQTAEAEQSSEAFSAPSAMVSEVVSMPEISTTEISTVAGSASLSLNSVTESVLPSSMMGSGLSRVMTSLNGRSAGMRGEMLERFGAPPPAKNRSPLHWNGSANIKLPTVRGRSLAPSFVAANARTMARKVNV